MQHGQRAGSVHRETQGGTLLGIRSVNHGHKENATQAMNKPGNTVTGPAAAAAHPYPGVAAPGVAAPGIAAGGLAR